jgi:hypothetical protein
MPRWSARARRRESSPHVSLAIRHIGPRRVEPPSGPPARRGDIAPGGRRAREIAWVRSAARRAPCTRPATVGTALDTSGATSPRPCRGDLTGATGFRWPAGFTRSSRTGEGFIKGRKGSLHGMTRLPRAYQRSPRARMRGFVSGEWCSRRIEGLVQRGERFPGRRARSPARGERFIPLRERSPAARARFLTVGRGVIPTRTPRVHVGDMVPA